MTMHKDLHPRDDMDTLYESRKEGGRGLASIENCVDASIRRKKDELQQCQHKDKQKKKKSREQKLKESDK